MRKFELRLYRRHLAELVFALALWSSAFVAQDSAQEVGRHASTVRPSISPQNAQKQNATFATSFRRETNTFSRAKVPCAKEIDLANKFIVDWANAMDGLVVEAFGAGSTDQMNSSLVREANLLRESFKAFGANLNRQPIEKVLQDLVNLKRRTNRLALAAYLRTHNPRWPQNSAQLASTVERVQSACMPSQDRAAMLVLNSPFRANKLMQSIGY